MDWYDGSKATENDFGDHIQMEIRINGVLDYSWCIDDMSYEESYNLYEKMSNSWSDDFDKIIFRRVFP